METEESRSKKNRDKISKFVCTIAFIAMSMIISKNVLRLLPGAKNRSVKPMEEPPLEGRFKILADRIKRGTYRNYDSVSSLYDNLMCAFLEKKGAYDEEAFYEAIDNAELRVSPFVKELDNAINLSLRLRYRPIDAPSFCVIMRAVVLSMSFEGYRKAYKYVLASETYNTLGNMSVLEDLVELFNKMNFHDRNGKTFVMFHKYEDVRKWRQYEATGRKFCGKYKVEECAMISLYDVIGNRAVERAVFGIMRTLCLFSDAEKFLSTSTNREMVDLASLVGRECAILSSATFEQYSFVNNCSRRQCVNAYRSLLAIKEKFGEEDLVFAFHKNGFVCAGAYSSIDEACVEIEEDKNVIETTLKENDFELKFGAIYFASSNKTGMGYFRFRNIEPFFKELARRETERENHNL